MKRLTAVIIAALIAAAFPVMAFAVPDEESSAASQSSVEAQSSADTSEADTSEADASKPEEKSSKPAEESSQASAAETDPDKMKFVSVNIPEVGMNIDLPADTYIITRDISPDDPALTAVKLTKQEVEKKFAENDTAVKAFAKDFSYDIIVTILENERTNAIGDLSSLAQAETDDIVEELMKNEYAKGSSIVTYNGVMYINLDMEYSSGDAHIYGMQEYTIVDGKNVLITFQVHDGKMTENQKKLFTRIMSGVTFDSVDNKPVISNVSETKVKDLDVRYLLILASAIVGVITLGAMIIVGSRYRHSKALEDEYEDEYEDERLPEEDIPSITPAKKAEKPQKMTYDNSLFPPADENVLFRNEKLAEEKKKREETRVIPRLDAATELNIPKNPYTPVGKAEAKTQPAMSVTSEIAKLSTISAEAAKAKAEKTMDAANDKESGDEVVFAESTPKQKTDIEQIGEAVFEQKEDDNSADGEKPAEVLSEYEKRFGKNRPAPAAGTASTIVPVTEDEKRMSKFEKHFGKVQPAAQPENQQDITIAAVDEIIRSDVLKNDSGSSTEITITKAPPKTAEADKTDDRPLYTMTKTTPMNVSLDKQSPSGENASAEELAVKKSPDDERSRAKNERLGFFARMKRSLYEDDEEESTPSAEEQKTETEKAEKSPTVVITAPTKETKNESGEEAELYRAPENKMNRFIELDVKKNENGNIVIGAANDQTGKVVPISVKNGDDELKKNRFDYSKLFEPKKPREESVLDRDDFYPDDKKDEAKSDKPAEDKKEEAKSDKPAEDKKEEVKSDKPAEDKKEGAKSDKPAEDKKEEVKSDKPAEDKKEGAKSDKPAEDKKEEVKSDKPAEDKKEEVKTEKPAEDKKEEAKSDKPAEDKKDEAKSDKPAEDKKEEAKSEKPAEDKKEEVKSDKPAEDKKDEVKSEKPAEDKKDEVKFDKPAEDKKEEVKSDKPAEDKKEEAKSEKPAEDKKEEVKSDKPAEDKKDEVKSDKPAEDKKEDAPVSAFEKKFGIANNAAVIAAAGEETKNVTAAAGTVIAAAGVTAAGALTALADEKKTAPAEKTESAEAEKTEAPAEKTESAEAEKTEAPAEKTESAEAEKTDTPAEKTESAEAEKTEAPAEKTESAEAEKTKAPAEKTESAEAEKTEAPAEKTESAEAEKTDTPAEKTESAEAEKTDAPAEKTESAEAEKPEEAPVVPAEPEYIFERDSGIEFEYGADPEPVIPRINIFTSIPRLESVNAEEYHKKFEQLKKMPPKPEPKPEPVSAQPDDEGFYSGYNGENDGTLDPFAPGSGDILPEESKGTSFKEKLKRSFGKLFSAGEDED